MNYAKHNASGTIYQSLSAEADYPKADNTLPDLHNSSDHTGAKFNKCFYFSFKITSNLNKN